MLTMSLAVATGPLQGKMPLGQKPMNYTNQCSVLLEDGKVSSSPKHMAKPISDVIRFLSAKNEAGGLRGGREGPPWV